VTDKLVAAIKARSIDFIVCNIATPTWSAIAASSTLAIKAVEAVVMALGRLTAAIVQAGGEMLISADHGNLEQMRADDGQRTRSTRLARARCVLSGARRLSQPGRCAIWHRRWLALMGLPQPVEMTDTAGHAR